jgi:hypothetical protein
MESRWRSRSNKAVETDAQGRPRAWSALLFLGAAHFYVRAHEDNWPASVAPIQARGTFGGARVLAYTLR